KSHWSHIFHTPKHIINLYKKKSLKEKKNIETIFSYEDNDFNYNISRLDAADVDTNGKNVHLIGDGNINFLFINTKIIKSSRKANVLLSEVTKLHINNALLILYRENRLRKIHLHITGIILHKSYIFKKKLLAFFSCLYYTYINVITYYCKPEFHTSRRVYCLEWNDQFGYHRLIMI
ncbi:hypothetical protein CR513_35719, partial [Mucuna pruriens]